MNLKNFNIDLAPAVQLLHPNSLITPDLIKRQQNTLKNELNAHHSSESDHGNSSIRCLRNALTFSRLFSPWSIHDNQNAARFPMSDLFILGHQACHSHIIEDCFLAVQHQFNANSAC
uniref:Uncharacterized protein n=1 Tax=Opuntia streptacantha TaxID=393608 RepID=A0A7C9D3T5_OPUST